MVELTEHQIQSISPQVWDHYCEIKRQSEDPKLPEAIKAEALRLLERIKCPTSQP